MGPGFESQRDHESYQISDNTPFVPECTLYIYKLRFDDSVAQLVEQYTFNVWVLGSNPSGITNKTNLKIFRFFYAQF